MTKKFMLLILALTLSISILAGCAASTPTTPPATGTTKTVLKIGMDDNYPPMEYRNANNELVGFDVALGKALAEKLDMTPEFISTAWDGIFIGLDTGNYDVIMSAVSITPKRLETLGFTKPYLANGQIIISRNGAETVTDPSDLAGKKVGVQMGTTGDVAAEKYKADNGFEIVKYDSIIQTFSGMDAGHVDYIVVDYPVGIEYVAKSPDKYAMTTVQFTNEPIGITVKKDNTALIAKLNTALDELKADGTLKKISEEWLGADYTSDIDEELNFVETE